MTSQWLYLFEKGKRNMEYTKLNYEGFEEYLKKEDSLNGGLHYLFEFENGFGASVIKSWVSYGHASDLFELAVLKDGGLCYTTEITDDVIGYLNNDEVLKLLEKLKNLSCDCK